VSTASAGALLDQIANVPTVPKVVRELMVEFERPETDIDRVVFLMRSDPNLAARVLRLANSAFYGRKGELARLQDAVVFVGTHATRNLVLSVGLAGSVKFPADFPRQSFWRYSLHAAVASRYVASRGRQDAETAFALGLMRAIGEPIVATAHNQALRELDATCRFYDEARLAAEQARLGFSYLDVTVELADRWHFPKEMVAALRQSAQPDDTHTGKMGAAVAVGAWISSEHERNAKAPTWMPETLKAQLRMAGVEGDLLGDMPPVAKLAESLEALVA